MAGRETLRTMRRYALVVVAALALGAGQSARSAHVPGWQAPEDASGVDADRLLADLRTLASPEMEGRRSGTAGSRRAREFILERFASLALHRVGSSYEHPFPADDNDTARDEGVNLMALAPGARDPHRIVLVSAHYDHVGIQGGRIYPGADDNASGVAVLLAAAASFARHPPDRSVLFVAFDGEEQGLRGSRHFVAHAPVPLDRITVVVNADMVGRGDAGRIVVAGTSHSPALEAPVVAAAQTRSIAVVFGHDRPARDSGVEDWTDSSDHAPFHRAGVPFLYFGVENHPDYHKPTDTPDRIRREFFVEAARLIVDTVRHLASSPGGDDGSR